MRRPGLPLTRSLVTPFAFSARRSGAVTGNWGASVPGFGPPMRQPGGQSRESHQTERNTFVGGLWPGLGKGEGAPRAGLGRVPSLPSRAVLRHPPASPQEPAHRGLWPVQQVPLSQAHPASQPWPSLLGREVTDFLPQRGFLPPPDFNLGRREGGAVFFCTTGSLASLLFSCGSAPSQPRSCDKSVTARQQSHRRFPTAQT